MKKLTKIISVLALLFSLFAALGSSMIETAEAVDDEVTVTLNKKKMTTLPDPLIQNTGSEMAQFAAYDDMPNVTFEALDVTAQFYAFRAAGDSVAEAMGKVAATPVGSTVGTDTTDANGLASFDLPAKSGGLDAVYVFVETDAPSGTTTTAANLALVLPMYNDDDEIMTDILLYPKNVVAADGTVTVTKKGTADGTVLPDADFIVSRELTPGNVEYLGTFNATLGLNNWVANRDDARVFTTGATGQITISNLEHGDYNLIEIAAPGNASIIDDGIKPFTISDNATILAFDVFNDTIIVIKDHEGTQDDYNVGDLIPYSIQVNIPRGMGYQFTNGEYRHPTMTITDAPDAGLQFNNDLILTAGTTTIPVDPLWLDTAGNGFTLTIPAAALAAYEGQDLLLTYHMYLDENADPDVGYNNLATVATDELSDNDYTPDVYTGGFRFLKVDANFDTNNTLPDAKFVIRDADNDGASYLKIDDTTNAISWVADLADATEFISNGDGEFEVAGLEYGTYYLEETEAPTDYVPLTERIEFEVGMHSYLEIVREVANIHKGRLPSTGGSGIVGIVALGATLVATTGGYYIKRKRDE